MSYVGFTRGHLPIVPVHAMGLAMHQDDHPELDNLKNRSYGSRIQHPEATNVWSLF
jgi:hypothetical protein